MLQTELLLRQLRKAATVTCASDQCVLVRTSGLIPIAGADPAQWPRFETHVIGNEFTLALADSYRLWCDERARGRATGRAREGEEP